MVESHCKPELMVACGSLLLRAEASVRRLNSMRWSIPGSCSYILLTYTRSKRGQTSQCLCEELQCTAANPFSQHLDNTLSEDDLD